MTQITIQMRKKSYSIESTWEEYKKVRFEMGLARWSDYNKQRWMEVKAKLKVKIGQQKQEIMRNKENIVPNPSQVFD